MFGGASASGRASRTVLAIGAAGLVAALAAAQLSAQFTSYSRNSRNILEGNWQSCREADGRYSERVYDHIVNGVPKYEVHMGPRREFAIFEGVQDEHRAHDSAANLLKPYRLEVEGNLASHEWKVPALGLVFSVSLSGGSRGDCESWYILLAPAAKPKPSH
jgi:hypothetical protein